MSATLLCKQFDFNQLLITRGIADLSNSDSLRGPQPAGNCINWVLGHILLTRSQLELMLGAQPLLSGPRWECYESGQDDLDRQCAIGLEELEQVTAESLSHMQDVIRASEPRMGEAIGTRGRNIAETIGTFVSHEAYHAGQIHLIRRTIGKAGVFK
ncbi:DinB family protein [candidate division KSB1 bacterium]|nr:DinB family protein [candidate division KSB1 bacterium]